MRLGAVGHVTTLGPTCWSNMPIGGCEVQDEQLPNPPVYAVTFTPLLGRPR